MCVLVFSSNPSPALRRTYLLSAYLADIMHHFGAVTPQVHHFIVLTQPPLHFGAVTPQVPNFTVLISTTAATFWSTSNKSPLCRITLLTRSVEELQLSNLVVPFIATPFQNCASLELSELSQLQGLQLAHRPSSDTEFTVSLLVGADYYWDIVGDKRILGSGPTAVESKLGYLISANKSTLIL